MGGEQDMDPNEIFSHLPANRCGEAERRYVEDLFAGGFSNKGESAGMVITSGEDYARRIRKAAVAGYAAVGARPGSTMAPRDTRQDWRYERHYS